jgi:predicted secreted protein with PEFG-CTERM motif
MKITSILLITVIILFPMLLTGKASADFNATNSEYFCNTKDLTIEKSGYSFFIYQENRYWSGESPQDIASTLLKTNHESPMLNNLGKAYHCLKDNHIDPNSIEKIPPFLLQGLDLAKKQDPVKFAQIAPDFDNYVPIPEFGTLAGMIVAISIMSVLIVSRKYGI